VEEVTKVCTSDLEAKLIEVLKEVNPTFQEDSLKEDSNKINLISRNL